MKRAGESRHGCILGIRGGIAGSASNAGHVSVVKLLSFVDHWMRLRMGIDADRQERVGEG